MKKLISAFLVMLMFLSCEEKLNTNDFANKTWVLSTWVEKSMPEEKLTLYMGSNGTFNGQSFCNSYGGKVSIVGQNVKFTDLLSTKIYCDKVAAAENKYFAELEIITVARMNKGKLELLQGDRMVMIFTPAN